MSDRMNSTLTIKMSNDLYNKLKAEADKREISLSELSRQLLNKGLSVSGAYDGLDIVQEIITETIHNSLRRTEERMAKLAAKAGVASATTMYLTTGLMQDLGTKDIVERYEKARKKAVDYVRTPFYPGSEK